MLLLGHPPVMRAAGRGAPTAHTGHAVGTDGSLTFAPYHTSPKQDMESTNYKTKLKTKGTVTERRREGRARARSGQRPRAPSPTQPSRPRPGSPGLGAPPAARASAPAQALGESIVLRVPRGVGRVGRLLNPGLRFPPPRGGRLLGGPRTCLPCAPQWPLRTVTAQGRRCGLRPSGGDPEEATAVKGGECRADRAQDPPLPCPLGWPWLGHQAPPTRRSGHSPAPGTEHDASSIPRCTSAFAAVPGLQCRAPQRPLSGQRASVPPRCQGRALRR